MHWIAHIRIIYLLLETRTSYTSVSAHSGLTAKSVKTGIDGMLSNGLIQMKLSYADQINKRYVLSVCNPTSSVADYIQFALTIHIERSFYHSVHNSICLELQNTFFFVLRT